MLFCNGVSILTVIALGRLKLFRAFEFEWLDRFFVGDR